MAGYKGSVELISGITQKNGGKFMLMDSSAVQYDDSGKSVREKIGELEAGAGNDIITNDEIDGLFRREI